MLTTRVFLGVAFLTSAFEVAKELMFGPALDPWKSHCMTVLLSATCAALVAMFVRKGTNHVYSPLCEREEKLRSLFELSPLGIVLTDMKGRFIEINDAFERICGYSKRDLESLNFWKLMSFESDAEEPAQLACLAHTGRYGPCEKEWVGKDGRPVPLRLNGSFVRGSGGGRYVWSTIEDITESNRREEGLRLAASVFANSTEGIIITGADNLAVDINPAFTRITGYSREEIIGKSPRILSSGRQHADFYAQMWDSLQQQDFWHGELWNRRRNGEVYAEMLAISAVRNAAGQVQHYIGVFSDISRLKAHENELHRIANYDTLTGLPNRRLLADRLRQALALAQRRKKPMAICYMDLDNFKTINDRYGYAVGDQILLKITERLTGVLRDEDTLARLGGDEFAVLLGELSHLEEVHLILDRVLAAVQVTETINDIPISISASLGCTVFPADDANADTLQRHAVQAMYRAKESGKNRYHLFDSDQHRQVQAHRDHLQRLRDALHNDEFVLYYQPKVDLINGDVIGAEALIRWQHPEQGLLPPAAFLHYLDGSDLEIEVGDWVIDTALKQIVAWNAIGLPLTVSVNVSAAHLLHPDFTERLRLSLERHPSLLPGKLELEVLETAALADLKQAGHTLTACHQLGVDFSLDDFGTGYSSLSYFRNLPIDVLKIDQSFVRDMLDDPDDLIIVESVVRLAHAYNRPVIAEGVETLEHGAMLVHLGCSLAQGYGIAAPMPPERFPLWRSTWRSAAAWLTLASRFSADDDLILLSAAQSLRNWVDKITRHLRSVNIERAELQGLEDFPFGRWYQNSGNARYGDFPEFRIMATEHDRVFRLAAKLIADVLEDRRDNVEPGMAELFGSRDNLLNLLDTLSRKHRKPGNPNFFASS